MVFSVKFRSNSLELYQTGSHHLYLTVLYVSSINSVRSSPILLIYSCPLQDFGVLIGAGKNQAASRSDRNRFDLQLRFRGSTFGKRSTREGKYVRA